MAKRKNKNEQRQAVDASDESSEGTNGGESNEESKSRQNPKGVIVLGVYMHCEGCAQKVVKCLRGFDGVEEIETDSNNHRVTVKGKNADPTRVAERLRKKSNKYVQLISPIPKEKKEEKKPEKKGEAKVVEVVLKIYLHCEGCAHDVKYRIHKMQGVHTVETDMGKSRVTVKGVFDPQKLVEYIHKRAGKHAVIEKQTQKGKKEDGQGKEGNKREADKKEKKEIYNFPPELVYAPQFFSDENPNSCSVL